MVFWLLISCLSLASGCGPPANAFEVAPHRGPKGFRNLYLRPQDRFLDFLRWQLSLGPHESPVFPPDEVPPYRPQIATPDLNHINGPDPRRIQVTWIGHSTFLVQVAGLNLLTDPICSERASPVSFAGPRRYAPPGLSWGQLPRTDAVVISHNHYDHLDLATVKRLGNRTRFFVPLGVAAWFREAGINNVVELDWGQQAEFGLLTFHCVSAQHFSARGLRDRNSVLSCSGVRSSVLDWPHVEGLRLDEALHPLTLMAFGLYGEVLPHQNGGPVRAVIPWKYGFKSGKSLVRIRLTEEQPKTAWEKASPQEYGFYSNVNPTVDHPRWSQATASAGSGEFMRRKTLMFNGYGDQVASLYGGMDLKKNC